jgi:hypothetical protein
VCFPGPLTPGGKEPLTDIEAKSWTLNDEDIKIPARNINSEKIHGAMFRAFWIDRGGEND